MARFHSLSVSDIRRETADCVSVALEVPADLRKSFSFAPGQYLTLKTRIGGEEVRRSYSLCTAPGAGEWRVAVKEVPGGLFSTFVNRKLSVGDLLEVMPPDGRFLHRVATDRAHYVGIAAGSGITPVMSILSSVLDNEPESRFTLFYGNRNSDSIIFHERLEALKNQYLGRLSLHHILSREHNGSDLFSGRIDAERLRVFFTRLVPAAGVNAYYLCGPAPMIEACREVLNELDVAADRIKFELFGSPADQERNTRAAVSLNTEAPPVAHATVTLDAFTAKIPVAEGESILDAARRAGMDAPFACKGGVCSTCRARLVAGEAPMEVNFALEADELAAGYLLTCQAHPTTEEVTVDFDA
ncbi:MAG: 1,2-phenylacetyl-CoA epoxidase subunit PaaE [Saprospiraceae bacterium]